MTSGKVPLLLRGGGGPGNLPRHRDLFPGMARQPQQGLADLAVSTDTPPMEARLVDRLPDGTGWQFEPKWDGFRCLAFRAGDEIDLRAKSGKPLGRYFPEVESFLLQLKTRRFVIDGELVIPENDSLSFDKLQLRLHPAQSRISRLARA